MSKTVVLVDHKKVEFAVGYQTAFDQIEGRYRIINDKGVLTDRSYNTRKNAELMASKIAKFKYVTKTWKESDKKAQKILGNEMYEAFQNMREEEKRQSIQAHVDSGVKFVAYDESDDLD